MKTLITILSLAAVAVGLLFAIAMPVDAGAVAMLHPGHLAGLHLTGIGAAGIILNRASLSNLFQAYNAAFKNGWMTAKPEWSVIATPVPSATSENHYAWLGQFPQLREWLGDREVKSMESYDYTLKNKKFESTVAVPRDTLDDDTYGIFSPLMEQMGYAAATHPDELIWPLLKAGISTPCYDGQYFFDIDHPVNGASVANVDSGGANNYWYLIDASRPLKPMIFQKRRDYAFRALNNLDDEQVFMRDEFRYGVDARVNAGFGFWQQAYASNQALDATHFDAAYQAMMALQSNQGRPLGIKATHLIVGPSNRSAALNTIEVDRLANGATNPNYKTVELVVTPYLP